MMMFTWIALILVVLAIIGIMIRIFRGPSLPDRLIALDAVGVLLISTIALISIVFDTIFFIDVILLIAIMSFIATVSFAKFIEKGEIIEHDRNR
jgi:multicomponent Na+:H+ antiporter subunit F